VSFPESAEHRRTYTARLGDRSLFPDLAARAYLNHGGISPASLAVRRAVNDVLDDYARRGAIAYTTWDEQRRRLKGKLAHLLGVHEADLALTANTTQGIIDIALCFPWKPGDRVIVFEGEFPANVTPWQRAATVFGLTTVFLPLSDYAAGDAPGLERLDRELSRGVRLVAVSAVEFQTGLRMPIRAIAERCHAHGAEVFVDGVQATGAVPLDAGALGIDYLACGSHKWLMSPEGAGFLYIHPDRVAALRRSVAGWRSHEEAFRFLLEGPGHLRYDRPIRKGADFLEGGNCNVLGFAALEAALDLILDIGVPGIYEHVNRYLDTLEAGLVDRGFSSLRARDPGRRSCILSVLPKPGSGLGVVDLHHELEARGIACATPDGVLRFTPHWPNHEDEIPAVLAAMDEGITAIRAR
jgi:selenocysteine lyase/cysteine desulfurase